MIQFSIYQYKLQKILKFDIIPEVALKKLMYITE